MKSVNNVLRLLQYLRILEPFDISRQFIFRDINKETSKFGEGPYGKGVSSPYGVTSGFHNDKRSLQSCLKTSRFVLEFTGLTLGLVNRP